MLGDDPEPPPLSADPNVGPTSGENPLEARLIAGFRYPVYDAHVEASRLRISVNFRERYRQWCDAQTSIAGEGGGHLAS